MRGCMKRRAWQNFRFLGKFARNISIVSVGCMCVVCVSISGWMGAWYKVDPVVSIDDLFFAWLNILLVYWIPLTHIHKYINNYPYCNLCRKASSNNPSMWSKTLNKKQTGQNKCLWPGIKLNNLLCPAN